MQKLFTASQIRAWDAYTITHEPITSIALMERASIAFANWFIRNYTTQYSVHVFCGPGNNGGDGLAICRLLQQKGYNVHPFLINPNNTLTADCAINLKKLSHVTQIESIDILRSFNFKDSDIIIDAVFGSGLSRPLNGIYKDVISYLNSQKSVKIAIDIPTGMFCDTTNTSEDVIFKNVIILSFQTSKRAFYFHKNRAQVASVIIVDIGLSDIYYNDTFTDWFTVEHLSEIPEFKLTNTFSFSPTTFQEHFGQAFDSTNSISLLKTFAKERQQTVLLNNDFTYIVIAEDKVYTLFDKK